MNETAFLDYPFTRSKRVRCKLVILCHVHPASITGISSSLSANTTATVEYGLSPKDTHGYSTFHILRLPATFHQIVVHLIVGQPRSVAQYVVVIADFFASIAFSSSRNVSCLLLLQLSNPSSYVSYFGSPTDFIIFDSFTYGYSKHSSLHFPLDDLELSIRLIANDDVSLLYVIAGNRH
jgi:hypothetical protein